MNVIRKALAVVLIVIISGLFTMGISAEKDTQSYENELVIMQSLGIMDESVPSAGKMQRKDFAKILYEILTYKTEKPKINVTEEEKTGLKEVSIDTSGFTDEIFFMDEVIEDIDFSADVTGSENTIKEETVVQLFSDVDEENEAFDAIMLANYTNLMTGSGNGKFEPSKNITAKEIAKIFVTMLGYRVEAEYNGGYPNGYWHTALKLKLLNNITLSMDDEVTAGQIAKIIYNAFSVKLMKSTNLIKEEDGTYTTSYKTEENVTFLSDLLGMIKIKGQVTANDVSNLSGKSGLLTGYMMINDVMYKVSEKIKNSQNYIGGYVEAYVTSSDRTVEEIRYINFITEAEVELIEAEDIAEFSGNTLTYYKNDKKRTVNIDASVPVIYNGLAVKTPTVDMYDIDAGSIRLTKIGGALKTVTIWKFKSFYIYGVDEIKKEFFNRDRTHVVNTDDKNDNRVYLFDEEGNPVDFSYIKRGQVVSYAKNKNVVTAYISRKFFSDTIDTIYYEDSKEKIGIKENKYELSSEYYENTEALELKAGKTYKFYTDYFGRIVWTEAEASEDCYSGIILDIISGGFNNGSIKLVSLDGIEPSEKEYEFSDTVRVECSDGTFKKYSGDGIVQELFDAKYIRYTIDSEEKVNYILVPLKQKGENGRLYTVAENKTYSYNYRTFFGGKVPIGENTKIVVEPMNAQDGDAYLFWEDIIYDIPSALYKIWAYQIAGEETPECIFIGNTFTASSDSIWYMDRYGANKVRILYDEEKGETYKAVEVNDIKGKKILRADFEYTDKNGNSCTALDIATGCADNNVYAIEKGDIFACTFYDAEKTKIKQVILLYRPTMKSPSGADGYIPTGAKSDMFFIKNSFIDAANSDMDLSLNTYSDGTYLKDGNPVVTGSETTINPYTGSGPLLTHGFLYHTNLDKYDYENKKQQQRQVMYYTTQDLSVADKYYETGLPDERVYDSTGEYTGVYINRVLNGCFLLRTFFEYNGSGDDFTVSRVNEGTLKPYTRYGNNCTRIIFPPQGEAIFINDNRIK